MNSTLRLGRLTIAALLMAVLGIILFPQPSRAQDGGFYIAGDLGYHWPSQMNTNVVGTNEHWAWSPSDNAAGFVRLGYALDSDWRIELEGGDRSASLGGIQADIFLPDTLIPARGVQFSGVNGHIDATTLMANGIYDIPLGLPLQPFVGAGAGLVHTDISARGSFPFCDICARPAICFPTCSINVKANGGNDALGVQGIAGVTWPFAPQWNLDATYRYVRASGVSWNTSPDVGFFSPGRFRGDYSDSSVTIGVRYSLGGM